MLNHATTAAEIPSFCGFRNDLDAHLQPGGIVVCVPEFLIMLRPVPRLAPVNDLLNPWMRWPDAQCDCWFIWLLCGNGSRALEMLVPVYGVKKWVAFQTGAQPKFWKFSKLQNLWPKAETTVRRSQSSGNLSQNPSERLGCPKL